MDKKIKQCTNIANYMRHRFNLTIEEVSSRTGVSRMVISRIENGSLSIGIDKFIALARFYHVPLDAILRNDFQTAIQHLNGPVMPAHKQYEQFRRLMALRQKTGIAG